MLSIVQSWRDGVISFAGKMGWEGTEEQEQGVLRLAIPVTFIGFLLLSPDGEGGYSDLWWTGLVFISIFLTLSAVFFASTLVSPAPSILRRLTTIVLDVGFLSYGLHLTGELGAPWIGVYLWITLGNGFRYGVKYLYVSGALSLMGYLAVVASTPYWQNSLALAIGLAVTILVIPAYCALLIRRLNHAKLQADEASRAKTEFLSRMSHEIRTPLNGILGMTELLQLRDLMPKERQYLNVIDASGKALARQIDEILDLSKIESGKMVLENAEFDLYLLLGQTLNMLAPQADVNQTQLLEEIDPYTPFKLFGDAHRLQQVFINLIGNAIKFTDGGKVIVRVLPRTVSGDQVTIRFEIADSGIGMEHSQIDSIFEPFAQANDGITRRYGGTGLGTTICKTLVNLMGGEIGVESELGEGTTFWFEITFAQSHDTTSETNWRSQCRTLYVSDSIDSEAVNWMHAKGVPFRHLSSLEVALKVVKNADDNGYPWDAMVIDQLPYDDNLDALLHAARELTGQSPFFIVIARDSYPPSVNNAPQAHFVLSEDSASSLLNNALHACYTKHGDQNVVHIANAQSVNQSKCKVLNVLIGEDNETNRLVLEHMITRLGHKPHLCKGGEAVLTALEESQYDVVIIDKNMPDMSGLDVYTAYSIHHGGVAPTPFVLLTADATPESKAASEQVGIEYFLSKPVSIGRLQATLEAACGRLSTTKSKKLPPPTRQELEAAAPTLPHLDPQVLENMANFSADPAKFYRDITDSFTQDVDSGLQGMSNALLVRNRSEFRDYAHALKGSASYMGMPRLTELCDNAQQLSVDDFERNVATIFNEIRDEVTRGIKALGAEAPFTLRTGRNGKT